MLIAELLNHGVRLQSHEAVAIAQQLIHNISAPVKLQPPLGPPSISNVQLADEGSVACLGCEVTPSVFEIAVLLQTLLPAGAGHVPGGLRYAIARGLLEVDVPPFDSIREFSRALERFERGDRRAAVRGALRRVVVAPSIARAATLQPIPAFSAPVQPIPAAATPVPRNYARAWAPAVAAVLFGAIALTGMAGLMHIRSSGPPAIAGVAKQTGVVSTGAGSAGRGTDSHDHERIGGRPSAAAAAVVPAPAQADRHARAAEVNRGARRHRRDVVSPTATDPVQQRSADGELVAALDGQHRPVFSPAFASNGSAMFFHTGRAADAHSALATMTSPETTGGDLAVMTILDDGARNFHVQPAPDGRWIAFDSDRDGERGVYIADRDGTNVRRITGAGYAAVPTWAPDSLRLTYVRAEPDNPKVWNLWLQKLDGSSAPTRLTHYRYGQPWSASWFPDNRRICYTHEDQIVILDVETGQSRQFVSPIKGRLVRTPAVSPDGSKVIFQLFRQGAWILDLADGSMRCVLTDPTAEEFAWAPDGRRVAFHSRRDGQWGIFILHRG
jgi:WD40-like Beta Propeller Repeat